MTWTVENLGSPTAPLVLQLVVALSDDGSTVAVQLNDSSTGTVSAGLWTETDGFTIVAQGTTATQYGPTDLSADGTVLVGNASANPPATASTVPFSWTAAGGRVDYAVQYANSANQAVAVSADGATLCGQIVTDSAFNAPPVSSYWDSPAAPTVIGSPAGTDISVCVGAVGSGTGRKFSGGPSQTAITGKVNLDQAYIWMNSGGFALLPFPAGMAYSLASPLSPDESTLLLSCAQSPSGIQGFPYWYDVASNTATPIPIPADQLYLLSAIKRPGNAMPALGFAAYNSSFATTPCVWERATNTTSALPIPTGAVLATVLMTNPAGTVIVAEAILGGQTVLLRWSQSSPTAVIGPRSALIV